MHSLVHRDTFGQNKKTSKGRYPPHWFTEAPLDSDRIPYIINTDGITCVFLSLVWSLLLLEECSIHSANHRARMQSWHTRGLSKWTLGYVKCFHLHNESHASLPDLVEGFFCGQPSKKRCQNNGFLMFLVDVPPHQSSDSLGQKWPNSGGFGGSFRLARAAQTRGQCFSPWSPYGFIWGLHEWGIPNSWIVF